MGDDRWKKLLLYWRPRTDKQNRGRPPTRWFDYWIQASQDKSGWRAMREAYVQQWTFYALVHCWVIMSLTEQPNTLHIKGIELLLLTMILTLIGAARSDLNLLWVSLSKMCSNRLELLYVVWSYFTCYVTASS